MSNNQIQITIEKMREKINAVEKNHRAFLLRDEYIEKTIREAINTISILPQRLRRGITLCISSSERLPNAYNTSRINITYVTMRHDGKMFVQKKIERRNVWKNSEFTTMYIPSKNDDEIKNILLKNMCFVD